MFLASWAKIGIVYKNKLGNVGTSKTMNENKEMIHFNLLVST